MAVSAYWATMFAGRVVLGPVAERVGPLRVLAGAVAGVPLGAALMAVPGPVILAVIGMMTVGLAAAPVFPLLTLTTARRTGAVGVARTTRTVGLQVAASAIGGTALPAGLGLAIGAFNASVLARARRARLGFVTSAREPGPAADREIRLGRVRQVIDHLVRDATAVARVDGSIHTLFPVAIGAAEGAAVGSWVVRERAARTIEVGLGHGICALFVCEGLLGNGGPDARHVVIDPRQDTRFASCGLQFLGDAGVAGLVEHHAGESQIVLPRLVSEGRRFDLAVIDGNHRFDAVFVDLFYLGRLLHPGGIAFVDDYHLPGVARAASFFLTNLGWSLEEVSTAEDRHHWAVLRTSAEPDRRPFEYFADF